jgi:hypothetical protein
VIQDDRIPKSYDRVTFERSVATGDWHRGQEPEFLAFGHPLIERMVHYCRVTKAADLGGKVACLAADYTGLPGVLINFLLRFEDREGRIIREELEPVFVEQDGRVRPDLGRKLFLYQGAPQGQPLSEVLERIRTEVSRLRHTAESYIRSQYQEYYQRVEQKRQEDITVLLDDVERFDRGIMDHLGARLKEVGDQQRDLFAEVEASSIRGQRTRIENQIRMHQHRVQERRREIENMRLGAFPAPELLNLVIVTPV